jgi:molybdenum cofactor cytidylyltransferase
MKFGPIPLDDALGHVLGHNIADAGGGRMLRKGRALTSADIAQLRALGRHSVYVAMQDADDIGEDAAAKAVARVIMGPGVHTVGAAGGRLNLLADQIGIARIDVARLTAINAIPGVTLATVNQHSAVDRRAITATIKIIPFALPAASIDQVRAICADGPVVRVDALPVRDVALLLSGSATARDRVIADFTAPLQRRVAHLGSRITHTEFIPLEDEEGEHALANEIEMLAGTDCGLIILAGETAIMDADDIAPRAIARAGGVVSVFGAPVDPGNLLLIGYIGDVPILGAPGCARSAKVNVIDWVLPRLCAGDRIAQADIAALGLGGLLEEIVERPSPRAT